ncbi:MAG: helix-turn-helix transcriptional regulator [Bacillota bacterium]|jgi:transcriptional regulator with XRE-family HTH domain|nr:helix-turn-helix transcriptional regulator [Bacillota bacterium]NLV63796.1 helix-turn-helix transcriptional regulator [Clostridiaceae bacterium]
MEINYREMGRRIAKRRKILNLTQEEISEATGLSNNHISNIENSHSIPSIETLMKVCEQLDVTPDYVLLGITKDSNEELVSQINQKLKLCGEKKLKLINNFITYIIDEDI